MVKLLATLDLIPASRKSPQSQAEVFLFVKAAVHTNLKIWFRSVAVAFMKQTNLFQICDLSDLTHDSGPNLP